MIKEEEEKTNPIEEIFSKINEEATVCSQLLENKKISKIEKAKLEGKMEGMKISIQIIAQAFNIELE